MITNGRVLRLWTCPILAWVLISGIACCCMSYPGMSENIVDPKDETGMPSPKIVFNVTVHGSSSSSPLICSANIGNGLLVSGTAYCTIDKTGNVSDWSPLSAWMASPYVNDQGEVELWTASGGPADWRMDRPKAP